MKKILLVFDGSNFSEAAFEFARRLNELHPILLTCAFLPHTELMQLWSYADAAASSLFMPAAKENEAAQLQEHIEHFTKQCKAANIDYRVHKDYFDFSLSELIKESRFADLVILGNETFYENNDTGISKSHLTDVLHDAKCPVLLVPENFKFPESIILSFDGSDDSIYAIKQFTYLFPELTDRETILVYASEVPDAALPEKNLTEELLSIHFSNLSFYTLEANPGEYFGTWLSEKKSTMLVSGSYGRSRLSALFRKSFAASIIEARQLPIFIAHR